MKAWFHARALREKILVVTLGLLVAAILGAQAWGQGRRLAQDWRAAQAEAAAQQVWLDHATDIAARAAAAGRSLEPGRTVNAARLVAELNALAARTGLAVDIGALRTERTDGFAFHSVQVGVRRTDLPSLVHFYEGLAARSPYLVLDQFALATDRAGGGQLNATFRVVSVELAP